MEREVCGEAGNNHYLSSEFLKNVMKAEEELSQLKQDGQHNEGVSLEEFLRAIEEFLFQSQHQVLNLSGHQLLSCISDEFQG